MIFRTSNRTWAVRYALSTVFWAWHIIVLLWYSLYGFNFNMDFTVNLLISGEGSCMSSTFSVKTFPKPSIHVILVSKHKNIFIWKKKLFRFCRINGFPQKFFCIFLLLVVILYIMRSQYRMNVWWNWKSNKTIDFYTWICLWHKGFGNGIFTNIENKRRRTVVVVVVVVSLLSSYLEMRCCYKNAVNRKASLNFMIVFFPHNIARKKKQHFEIELYFEIWKRFKRTRKYN